MKEPYGEGAANHAGPESDGRRLMKDLPGTTSDTLFAYDGWQVIVEYDSAGTPLRKYAYGAFINEPLFLDVADENGEFEGHIGEEGEEPGWIYYPRERYYYHQTPIYNVAALTSYRSHTLVERYDYDPYGKYTLIQPDDTRTESGPSTVGNPMTFTGHWFDRETGMYWMRKRYYTINGFFIGRDPQAYNDGVDLYSYCSTNPIINYDTYGLWASGKLGYPNEHQRLTMKSLALLPNFFNIFTKNMSLVNILIDSNTGQDDSPGFNENKRHYNRDTNQSPQQGNAAYTAYLQSEMIDFDIDLMFAPPLFSSGYNGSCKLALQALGRLSHSWQDYYAHAILLSTRQAGPAWSAIPPITGSPDNLNPQLIPSSYGKFGGEHSRMGLIEPADMDGLTGGMLRRNDAVQFVYQKYTVCLTLWLAHCECNAGKGDMFQ